MDFANLSREVAENLLEKNAVKISVDPPFTWTSGIKSPIYCDNRKMISFVKERKLVIEGFVKLFEARVAEFGEDWRPDYLGGTATAAIPWAAFLAARLDLPMIYIRPQKKAHGAGKQIEGDLEAGKKVLIVEDLISTGGSSVEAARAVREEGGCVVEEIFAIVTYGFPISVEKFAAADLKMSTLTNFGVLAEVAGEKGFIDEDGLAMVEDFAKDPKNWGEKNGF